MYANVRGTRLYFDVDGPQLVANGTGMAQRPTVMLLHGGPGGDHTGFRAHAKWLREIAQLVYLDNRGSGRSADGDPASYSLDNNVEDIAALCDYLGIERPILLGGSYGGMVAQSFAVRYPTRLQKLILVATAPSFRFIDDARHIVETRGTPEQRRVCQRLWNGNFENLEQVREFYELMNPWYSLTATPEKFAASWSRARRSVAAFNAGFGGFLRRFDVIDQLPQITCPTLVLGGAHDWICPPQHSRLIAERIPQAELHIFENSAHSIAADEPERYLELVTKFLLEPLAA
jgi:proline iminopeptidase